MATTTKDVFYAAIGIGDLAVSKARGAKLPNFDFSQMKTQFERISSDAIGRSVVLYGDLVKRGAETVTTIRSSSPTKRAVAQTKAARTHTKAAVTSARKAAATTVEATKQAISSV